ncbi:hypothetical protein [Flavobacterium laiguense]|uniref:Uncharacterized protein n=1 Tax=Flavobacterium laiguense TaxID=2169409 RepID=A0A2U1JTU7_9FLAO|nr:hypothetical protein [Flavobacterium laiguense]PWA08293.1 hypothetical protein DB891_11845 [Flavobacterium laiguense]
MDNIDYKITVGSLVKIKSKKTNSTYRVTKLYNNYIGELWAQCLNIESGENPEHPVNDLELFKENK